VKLLTHKSFIYVKKIAKELEISTSLPERRVKKRNIAKELEISTSLPERRVKKRNIHHPGEESSVLVFEVLTAVSTKMAVFWV
jgi:hypothetical protein